MTILLLPCRWAELESGATTIAFTPLHQRETDGLSGEVQLPDAAAARGPVEVCFVSRTSTRRTGAPWSTGRCP